MNERTTRVLSAIASNSSSPVRNIDPPPVMQHSTISGWYVKNSRLKSTSLSILPRAFS